jgi:hypothetical protein
MDQLSTSKISEISPGQLSNSGLNDEVAMSQHQRSNPAHDILIALYYPHLYSIQAISSSFHAFALFLIGTSLARTDPLSFSFAALPHSSAQRLIGILSSILFIRNSNIP